MYVAYRSYTTGQWSRVYKSQYDLRSAYPFLFPTSSKQLEIAATVDVLWTDMGWTQPQAAGGVN
jgi:hypothetical protein